MVVVMLPAGRKQHRASQHLQCESADTEPFTRKIFCCCRIFQRQHPQNAYQTRGKNEHQAVPQELPAMGQADCRHRKQKRDFAGMEQGVADSIDGSAECYLAAQQCHHQEHRGGNSLTGVNRWRFGLNHNNNRPANNCEQKCIGPARLITDIVFHGRLHIFEL